MRRDGRHQGQSSAPGKALPASTLMRMLAILAAALLAGAASLGLADDLWSQALSVNGTVGTEDLNVEFTSAFTNDDGTMNDAARDPDDEDGGIDPGYDKAVARCLAVMGEDRSRVEVAIANGFPSYTCRFWIIIKNVGGRPVRHTGAAISAPPEMTVTEHAPQPCGLLEPGQSEVEEFTVHVEQIAAQNASYRFTIRKTFSEAAAGTIGFWSNWDSHNTFTRAQIESWLVEIDSSSAWFDSLSTVAHMEAVFAGARGKGATPMSRFKAQYLATRLNERSGMLCPAATHDVRSKDPGNYLGLADPQSATLAQIIAAIESKHGTSPTNAQFNIMKDVCDALNNLAL